ncbi:RBM17 [Symbiodinium necroappetens]|uniref:RBM17 protein n=1 Tax=Symbiodinium necroappetens TaxID=1628268 RepID=A0A813B094_9DINO|nr:RBM17 [Symbiodinium necroappetens]
MDLEKQALEMAEKALASLPAAARAAKLDSVKAGILKRLQAGSVSRPAAPAPAPPVPPPPPPPPSEPSPEREGSSATGVEGVELFGDVPWFADSELRARLLEDVRQAHAAEKILVASPMEEIPRILPKSGQVLGAGAVLRLGGVHHGGYGESDINYAYRQLSRALHPDKNPGIEEAHDAFKRLGEASEDRLFLCQTPRCIDRIRCQVTQGGPASAESLERPMIMLRYAADAQQRQGNHFTNHRWTMSHVLAVYSNHWLVGASSGLVAPYPAPGSVLFLPKRAGEGMPSEAALRRSTAAFVAQPAFQGCRPQELLGKWYQESHLLDLFTKAPLRIAYDCSQKPFRAQFLCSLSRAAEAEANRNDSCVRGSWHQVMAQFPELGLWKELQDKIRSRIWASGAAAAGKRSRNSKWDDKSAASCATEWGKKWRTILQDVLPGAEAASRPDGDLEIQKLCMVLWKDTAPWVGDGFLQHLRLFQASDAGPSIDDETKWAFVPATDLLLLVGEGLVGCTAEGCFVQSDSGAARKPFLEALKNWRSSLRKNRGETTTDSAVRLWKSSAKRNSQKESETAKRARTTENKEGAPEEVQAKLNRSPTKVLLLTNVAPAKQPEETIKATVEEWVKKFGSVKECTVVRVPDVPEEDAIRVFVVFDSIKASSKAYASLRGQVTDGRVLRARFYDEKRFQDGELYKAIPSRMLVLTNLVRPEELDGGLQDEVRHLAKQHGKLCRCVVKTLSDLQPEESVRVFLEFSTVDEAVKAQAALHGQDFGLHRIKARYFNEAQLPGE